MMNDLKADLLKLSFSTLACPQWDWETVMQKAKALGYCGIEMRGLKDKLDNEKLACFQRDRIDDTLAQLKDTGVFLTCIDTSCSFLSNNAFSRTFDSGKAAIELASSLGVKYIRVFGDIIPDGMAKEAAIALVAGGLQQFGTYAGEHGVTVLLEAHGSFVTSPMLLDVFERIESHAVGVLWDTAHTFWAGETPEYTWSKLKHLIGHVHMKDFICLDGKETPCLPGCGTVPIGRILGTLIEGAYAGWYSFEWEKRWYPSIEGPETALPCFVKISKMLLQDT